MGSAEVMLEVIPSFIHLGGAFPCMNIVFEDVIFVEDDEGEVDCLALCDFSIICNGVINQKVNCVENNIDRLTGIADHQFCDSSFVIQVLWCNFTIIWVEEINDFRG